MAQAQLQPRAQKDLGYEQFPDGPVHGGDAAAKALSGLESFGTRNMFYGDARLLKNLKKQAPPVGIDTSLGASRVVTPTRMEESTPSGIIPPVEVVISANKVTEERILPQIPAIVVTEAPPLSKTSEDDSLLFKEIHSSFPTSGKEGSKILRVRSIFHMKIFQRMELGRAKKLVIPKSQS